MKQPAIANSPPIRNSSCCNVRMRLVNTRSRPTVHSYFLFTIMKICHQSCKLQRVQNCLARVILRAPRFSPSLPLLKQLHWLPVNYRIKFKLCTLTFRALAIHQPPYLASLLHFSNIPRQLRSSTSQQLSIPRTKLNLGKRAFSVAAPIIWNELPTTLKSCESLASFRKNLKTYLFKIAFPP